MGRATSAVVGEGAGGELTLVLSCLCMDLLVLYVIFNFKGTLSQVLSILLW